jgi:hypothetical protein
LIVLVNYYLEEVLEKLKIENPMEFDDLARVLVVGALEVVVAVVVFQEIEVILSKVFFVVVELNYYLRDLHYYYYYLIL